MSVFIVAEVGVNAAGNLDLGKQLTDAAAEAGADAVKTQLWDHGTFPGLNHLKWTQYQVRLLKECADGLGIKWFCTAFDLESIEFLASIGMRIWKVPNNLAVHGNRRLLYAIAAQDGDLWLCSADVSLPEFTRPVVYLHCVSTYPCPPHKADLRKLATSTKLSGISDHSGLPEISIAAVALGAKVVECHITLDKNAEGPDHKASLTPDEFAYMVRAIRNVEESIS